MSDPRCTIHGPMRYRFAGEWWVCPGWDGEGCCAVTAEQVAASIADVVAYAPAPGSQPSRWGFRQAMPA